MFLIVSFLYTFFTFCDTEKFNSNRECLAYVLISYVVITLLSCLAWYVTKDILFVATSIGSLSWGEFCKIARHDYYDSGYGAPEVATDLKIFTTKGYFYRQEICDGMECWEYEEFKYHPISTEKLDTSKVKTFVGGCWSTLSDIIERGKDNE